MGLTTQYQYDTFGRLTGVVLPPVLDPSSGHTVNPTTNYSYDIYGNMTQISDALGRQTTFTFDQFGHQTSRALPPIPSPPPLPPTVYTENESYDPYGRQLNQIDFAGNKTVYGYDTLGRLHTKTLYPYTNLNTPGETITYNFDNYGRNWTVVDVVGSTSPTTRTTTYGYDIENRVTSVSASVTISGVTTPQGTINYGYDQTTGRHIETSTTYPPSTTINSDIKYGYDQLGRLQTVNVVAQNGQTTNLTITYHYKPVGTIDYITYPNGTETDYGYDPLNRLTSVTNKVTGGNTLSSYSYTLNADGLRTGVSETDNVPSTVTKTWTYDNLQRLTSEAVVSSNSYTDTYTYDLVGNRLSKTDVVGNTTTVTTDSFNTDDQLTSETGTVNNVSSWSTGFQYDPNGSLTSVSRTGSGAETDTYTYDLQKRLSGATIRRSENGQTVNITASYTYDDSGYRASGTVTINNGTPTTTNYLTDTNNSTGYTQVLEEHTSGTAPSMSYIIGLAVVGQTNGTGASSYFMPDALGSTRLVVDPSGTIIVRYQYDAYGNVLGVSLGVLSPPATEILYTGQYFVVALQQYNSRARYYDERVGRFTTLDTYFGDRRRPQSLHKYLYAYGDPTNVVDPSGMDGDLESLMVTLEAQLRLNLMVLNFIGMVVNTANALLDLVKAKSRFDWLDFWGGVGYLGDAIVHIGLAALSYFGFKGAQSIGTGPPQMRSVVGSFSIGADGAVAMYGAASANAAIAAWLAIDVGGVAATFAGVDNFVQNHFMDWRLRFPNGKEIPGAEGEVISGTETTGTGTLPWPDQLQTHTEWKFLFEELDEWQAVNGPLKPGSWVELEGEFEPCWSCEAWLRSEAQRRQLNILYRAGGKVWKFP